MDEACGRRSLLACAIYLRRGNSSYSWPSYFLEKQNLPVAKGKKMVEIAERLIKVRRA